jgi:hypothetical protein
METNQLTAVSVEQLRALAERIREAKAGAVKEMKTAIEAMHEEGTLLMQAELELGAAFDGWVDGLADHGVDPMQARYCMKVARKHKDVRSLFSDPGAAKQLVLQNFAPPMPPKPEREERDTPAYTLTVRFNVDPLDPAFPRARFLAEPQLRSLIGVVQELETVTGTLK